MSTPATLQPGLIEAAAPPERRGIERDSVRMLVTERRNGRHSHARFFDLASLLRKGDVLAVNDSATLPAAIRSRRRTAESLLLHVSTMIDNRLWMTEPRGRVVSGEELRLSGDGSVTMIAPVEPERPRVWYASFQIPLPMNAYLSRFGEPIRYGYISTHFPLTDYQTMFAREPGSSEMPSAARPFTPRVVRSLRERGIEFVTITLHCGVASFESPERPTIERYFVSPRAAEAVNRARDERRRIIAVGTTSLRALESAVCDGKVVASSGWTDLVIDERYKLKSSDGLLTGFHDSAATHQWILRSFLGGDLVASAYDEAAAHGYYKHEFGDVHLIL